MSPLALRATYKLPAPSKATPAGECPGVANRPTFPFRSPLWRGPPRRALTNRVPPLSKASPNGSPSGKVTPPLMNTLDWACGLVWRIHQTGKVLGLRELVIGAGHRSEERRVGHA